MVTKTKKKSEFGWKAVLRNYRRKNFFKSLHRPIGFLVPVILVTLWFDITPSEWICSISNIIISGFPSLIGFIITGYAIFIGISSLDLLKELTKPLSTGRSLYQTVSSSFSFILLALIVTYILGSVCYVSTNTISFAPVLIKNSEIADKIGYIVLYILIFSLLYCIFSLLDVVVNIYNYSIYIQHYVRIKKENEEKTDKAIDSLTLCDKISQMISNLRRLIRK